MLFGLSHWGNPDVTPLGLANIGLAGILLGTVFFAPGGIWTAWGAHLGWNLSLAALGAPVSGLPLRDSGARVQPGRSRLAERRGVRPRGRGARLRGHDRRDRRGDPLDTEGGGDGMRQAAVVGAGTMGNGIAHVFAQHGWEVALIDVAQPALDRGMATIRGNLDRQVKKGTLTAAAGRRGHGPDLARTCRSTPPRRRSW